MVLLASPCVTFANPIDVTYTVTGNSGNYVLDFTVTNNMTAFPSEDIYFFGVYLPNGSVNDSPTGYDPAFYPTWNNSSPVNYGGSNIVYNNVWIDFRANHFPGSASATSLSGFKVGISDTDIPSTVNWFAFASGSVVYTGGGNFSPGIGERNPGFEGIAAFTVPEPATLTLICGGIAFIGVGQLRRWRRNPV